MANKDTVTRIYMQNAEIFADAFNFLIYGGKPVIDPAGLHEVDTAELVVPYGKDGVEISVQKYRDNLKHLTAMEDEKAAYLILGVENQSEIHYAMPVRDMLYDAMQYAKQVEKVASSYRAEAKKRAEQKRKEFSDQEDGNRKEENPSRGEFLSGFHKDDRLLPVITLVILFSPEPWDGPMSIHEMLAEVDEEFLPFIPDYRINLIAPAAVDVESMDRFRSSLREVLLYIKYSRDKKRLQSLLEADPHFQELDTEAVVVIDTVTNSKLKFNRKGKKVNMCQAIVEIREESRKEGREEGSQEEKKKVAKRMLAAGKLSIGEIAEYTGLNVEMVKELAV